MTHLTSTTLMFRRLLHKSLKTYTTQMKHRINSTSFRLTRRVRRIIVIRNTLSTIQYLQTMRVRMSTNQIKKRLKFSSKQLKQLVKKKQKRKLNLTQLKQNLTKLNRKHLKTKQLRIKKSKKTRNLLKFKQKNTYSMTTTMTRVIV